MRLYLSSYRLGNQPDKFVSLFGSNKRAALILNARDNFSPTDREKGTVEQAEVLAKLGIIASELDLRKFFGNPDALRKELSQYDAVWIPGGNAFLLRRAMHDSGFDLIIKNLLDQDKIVYAGYSAAVIVLSPTLRGIELVDDASAVRETYQVDPIWDGLSILSYSVVPHYQSNHPESAAIDKVVEFFEKERIPFKPLKDGQAIVINGKREEIVG